jgi:peptidoglycan/xylan/chitin deacetylase (PgdA/CDA1 family)
MTRESRYRVRRLTPESMPLLRYIRQSFRRPCAPIILMFHRVADAECDPWGLSVAPWRFEEQMRALKARRIPLSIANMVSRLNEGTLPPEAVAVTFDDGYVDNLRVAKPILEKIGVPATVFLTTGYVGTRKEFWWDELSRLVLGGHTPVEGIVVIGGRSIAVRLPAVADQTSQRLLWRAWEPPRTPREHLYFQIWNELRVLEPSAREEQLDCVRQLFGRHAPSENDLPMTAEDVRQLVAGTCIEIGAHSETHQPLTTLGVNDRRREIERSRAVCETLAGKAIEGFAYPHGDRDTLTADLVRESGFRWACSTHPAALNRDRFDPFNLPRVQALDWTAPELERALQRARPDA